MVGNGTVRLEKLVKQYYQQDCADALCCELIIGIAMLKHGHFLADAKNL